MGDERRVEALAEIGLRLILEAYAAHPDPVLLGAANGLGLKHVDDGHFQDPGERQHRLTGEKGRLVLPLIQCMIADGILRGRQAGSGDMLVNVAAPVRHELRQVHHHKSVHDKIKVELDVAFHGDDVATGTFTDLARRIGFEP